MIYIIILFLRAVKGHRKGTEAEIDILKSHTKKGCLEDPYPNMHVPLSGDEYPDLFCLRGESMVESVNKIVNKLVYEITRMSAELAHTKTWLRMTNINLKKDAVLQHHLKIECPRTIDWFLQEALINKHPHLKSNNKTIFPSIKKGYDEPYIGIGYGKLKSDERIQNELDHHYEIAIQENSEIEIDCPSGVCDSNSPTKKMARRAVVGNIDDEEHVKKLLL